MCRGEGRKERRKIRINFSLIRNMVGSGGGALLLSMSRCKVLTDFFVDSVGWLMIRLCIYRVIFRLSDWDDSDDDKASSRLVQGNEKLHELRRLIGQRKEEVCWKKVSNIARMIRNLVFYFLVSLRVSVCALFFLEKCPSLNRTFSTFRCSSKEKVFLCNHMIQPELLKSELKHRIFRLRAAKKVF